MSAHFVPGGIPSSGPALGFVVDEAADETHIILHVRYSRERSGAALARKRSTSVRVTASPRDCSAPPRGARAARADRESRAAIASAQARAAGARSSARRPKPRRRTAVARRDRVGSGSSSCRSNAASGACAAGSGCGGSGSSHVDARRRTGRRARDALLDDAKRLAADREDAEQAAASPDANRRSRPSCRHRTVSRRRPRSPARIATTPKRFSPRRQRATMSR